MKFFAPIALAACPLLQTAYGSNAFVPPVGRAFYYRYSDTIKQGKKTQYLTATLTLKTSAENDILATLAVDGKSTHHLEFYVDQTGALQPLGFPQTEPSGPRKAAGQDVIAQRAAIQAFLNRLSIASRIAAHPDSSFPIQMDIAWASGPVNPVLTVRSTAPNAFVGDASATTYINAPEHKNGLSLLVPITFGLAEVFTGGTAAGVIGVAGGGVSIWSSDHASASHPLPADVTLHLTGQVAEGRLQILNADQENIVHNGKRTVVVKNTWSLAAAG